MRHIVFAKGVSSWNLWKLAKYAIDGIIGFSTLPLRIPLLIGGCISGGAIIYGVCIMIDTFLYGNSVQGYASLICLVLFLGGFESNGCGHRGRIHCPHLRAVQKSPTLPY